MIIILITITLAGGVAIYFIMNNGKNTKGPTIDQIIKTSVDVPDITTNLQGDNYIKISFKIQTNSTDAQKELTKRDFQVKNIIIETLSDMKEQDLQGKKGMVNLEQTLKTKINQVMQDGKVVQVYITDSLLQ